MAPKFQLSQMALDELFTHLAQGMYVVDKNRQIRFWNEKAEELTGFPAEEVVGHNCMDNILNHVDDEGNLICLTGCPLQRTIEESIPLTVQVYLRHKEGHRVPITVTSLPLYDKEHNLVGAVELFSDISYQKALESRVEELKDMALLDALTKLPNRGYCQSELSNLFNEYSRYGHRFGVFFIDIDHFKGFNDTYGHDLGDKVLTMVGGTLKNALRPFDFVGRWGGEEFLVFAKNVDLAAMEVIGQRLRKLVEKSTIPHENERLGATISIGGSLVQKEDTPESLLHRADTLMYESKTGGRNRLTLHQDE